MASSVYTANLTIYTGTDFSQDFVFEKTDTNSRFNLTGYSICARMKKAEESKTSIPFTISIIDVANSRIVISMNSTTTSTLKSGKYLYDILFQSPDGKIERIVEGTVDVKRTVSR